jgi:hypothetical protein
MRGEAALLCRLRCNTRDAVTALAALRLRIGLNLSIRLQPLLRALFALLIEFLPLLRALRGRKISQLPGFLLTQRAFLALLAAQLLARWHSGYNGRGRGVAGRRCSSCSSGCICPRIIDRAWRGLTHWSCGSLRRLALWCSLPLRCSPVLWRGLALGHGLALRHRLPLWGSLNLWRSLALWRRTARYWGCWTRRRRSFALSLSLSLRVGTHRDHQGCNTQHGRKLQRFSHDRILRYNHTDRSLK